MMSDTITRTIRNLESIVQRNEEQSDVTTRGERIQFRTTPDVVLFLKRRAFPGESLGTVAARALERYALYADYVEHMRRDELLPELADFDLDILVDVYELNPSGTIGGVAEALRMPGGQIIARHYGINSLDLAEDIEALEPIHHAPLLDFIEREASARARQRES